jgi:predicted CoA-binding protein
MKFFLKKHFYVENQLKTKAMQKKTLVLGASNHPERYSFMAVKRLVAAGHGVYALGSYSGKINDIPITLEAQKWEDVDTVTIYLNKKNQEIYSDYLLDLQPRRVIFNPGSENHTLKRRLESIGVEVLYACTLVMLSTGQY